MPIDVSCDSALSELLQTRSIFMLGISPNAIAAQLSYFDTYLCLKSRSLDHVNIRV
jgi:hypothetical protein